MKTLADVKRAMVPGSKWDAYFVPLQRSLGVREVARNQPSFVTFLTESGRESYLYWPKASEVVVRENAVDVYEDGEHLLTYTKEE